jgi:hypothetical protein
MKTADNAVVELPVRRRIHRYGQQKTATLHKTERYVKPNDRNISTPPAFRRCGDSVGCGQQAARQLIGGCVECPDSRMGLCPPLTLEGVEGARFVASIGLRFGSDLHWSMSYYRA